MAFERTVCLFCTWKRRKIGMIIEFVLALFRVANAKVESYNRKMILGRTKNAGIEMIAIRLSTMTSFGMPLLVSIQMAFLRKPDQRRPLS